MSKTDQIKQLLSEGKKQIEIAEEVGVTQAYVSQVKCGVHTRLDRKRRQAERQRQDNLYPKKSFDRKKKKARKEGRDFLIEWKDLEHPSHCPILGTELDYSGKGDWSVQPSIDRIDNDLGYVPGNVWIISMKANTLKRQKDLTDFLQEVSESVTRVTEIVP